MKKWEHPTNEDVEIDEAVNLKKLRKEYDKNEDKNYHTENYLLLAKAFGTPAEVKKVEEILKRNKKQGSTSQEDSDWMYKNINKYFDKIRKEEVELDESEANDKRNAAINVGIDLRTYLKKHRGETELEKIRDILLKGKLPQVKDMPDDDKSKK